MGFPAGFGDPLFLLTNDLKQGELTMLCWFVVPSCGTHKETEGSLRDFRVVVVQRWQRTVQNRVIYVQRCCLLI